MLKSQNDTKAPKRDINPTRTQTFITGIITAISDVLVTHPLWTIKTWKQQQMTRRQIFSYATRNPLLLYNGLGFHMLAMLPLTTIRISLSSELHKKLQKSYKTEVPAIVLLSSSFLAGYIGSLTSAPTELIRTTLLKQAVLSVQPNENFKGNRGFVRITIDLVKAKGLRSLTCGMLSVNLRDGFYTAAFVSGAPLLKKTFAEYIPNNVINSIVSYTIASVASTLTNHPFDTIKTLQHTSMAMNFLKNDNQPIGILSACRKVMNNDGFFGFWKGYTPRGLRFLIGLSVKATCIEKMGNYWREKNKDEI